ncbi:hypothetical protein [Flavobacterium sp.]|nr:hypothetical protein [Flavobacterium sp.]
MKHIIFTTLLVSGLAGVMAPSAFAQQDTVVKDTVMKKKSKDFSLATFSK